MLSAHVVSHTTHTRIPQHTTHTRIPHTHTHTHTFPSQNTQLYAFKGLAGKLGPVGVHASMLAIIAGVAVCCLCSSKGELLIPTGGQALTSSGLTPITPLAGLPAGARSVLQVNDFEIAYRSDGSIEQFYTDLSVLNLQTGDEVYRYVGVGGCGGGCLCVCVRERECWCVCGHNRYASTIKQTSNQ